MFSKSQTKIIEPALSLHSTDNSFPEDALIDIGLYKPFGDYLRIGSDAILLLGDDIDCGKTSIGKLLADAYKEKRAELVVQNDPTIFFTEDGPLMVESNDPHDYMKDEPYGFRELLEGTAKTYPITCIIHLTHEERLEILNDFTKLDAESYLTDQYLDERLVSGFSKGIRPPSCYLLGWHDDLNERAQKAIQIINECLDDTEQQTS